MMKASEGYLSGCKERSKGLSKLVQNIQSSSWLDNQIKSQFPTPSITMCVEKELPSVLGYGPGRKNHRG